METEEQAIKKSGDYLADLQQWQRDILEMENFNVSNLFENENEIPITKAQADMLEEVLGNDFFIGDEKVRDILEAVWECGFYYERDRKVLNWARKCFLEGKNWIKNGEKY